MSDERKIEFQLTVDGQQAVQTLDEVAQREERLAKRQLTGDKNINRDAEDIANGFKKIGKSGEEAGHGIRSSLVHALRSFRAEAGAIPGMGMAMHVLRAAAHPVGLAFVAVAIGAGLLVEKLKEIYQQGKEAAKFLVALGDTSSTFGRIALSIQQARLKFSDFIASLEEIKNRADTAAEALSKLNAEAKILQDAESQKRGADKKKELDQVERLESIGHISSAEARRRRTGIETKYEGLEKTAQEKALTDQQTRTQQAKDRAQSEAGVHTQNAAEYLAKKVDLETVAAQKKKEADDRAKFNEPELKKLQEEAAGYQTRVGISPDLRDTLTRITQEKISKLTSQSQGLEAASALAAHKAEIMGKLAEAEQSAATAATETARKLNDEWGELDLKLIALAQTAQAINSGTPLILPGLNTNGLTGPVLPEKSVQLNMASADRILELLLKHEKDIGPKTTAGQILNE